MPAHSMRILVADPDPALVTEIGSIFAQDDCYLVAAPTGAEAVELANQQAFDAVISESRLEGTGGLALVGELRKLHPHLPVVILTARPRSDSAIAAIKAGAYDFLAKPPDGEELRKVVRDAVAASRLMSKQVEIGTSADTSRDGDALIGRSRQMLEVYKSLGRLSPTPVTVLIRGETGTGKELIARALFQHGHRAHRPFVAVNCAAIPESLLESELFGHEKGAFTGATETRIGKFEQAHNATLFLDEIGDLDLSLQARLLRVLQEKQIERVGGREEIPVDVRIIAATHRDIEQMVRDGEFREDLFYRLNVAAIELPPLRSRKEDIPQLTEYFLQRYGREFRLERPAITRAAMRYLEEQPWPGNVRQLQNIIRKALLDCRGFAIDRPDLQRALRESSTVSGIETGASADPRHDSLGDLAAGLLSRARSGEIGGAYAAAVEELERRLLPEAVDEAGGNLSEAARWLGISRLTLREKLRRLGLRPRPAPRKGDTK